VTAATGLSSAAPSLAPEPFLEATGEGEGRGEAATSTPSSPPWEVARAGDPQGAGSPLSDSDVSDSEVSESEVSDSELSEESEVSSEMDGAAWEARTAGSLPSSLEEESSLEDESSLELDVESSLSDSSSLLDEM